ncbi:MAG: aspartate dehydrogenase [Microbacteriaceae bacterium]
MTEHKVSLGIVGLGAIGTAVLKALVGNKHYRVQGVVGREPEKTRQQLDALGFADIPLYRAEELADKVDIVIDAAPAAAFRTFAESTVRAGKALAVVSVGALLENFDLIALAKESGARIHVMSGAIAGLDGVRAAAQGEIFNAKIVTRKPSASLGTSAASSAASEAELLYQGTVREAFALFPANVNVAVAFSLAGIGPDRTEIEVWSDPALQHNTHTLRVESDSGTITVTMENIPSENPKTARLTAQSVLAWLEKQSTHFPIGT